MLQNVGPRRASPATDHRPATLHRRVDDVVDLRHLLVTLLDRKSTIVFFVLLALACAAFYLSRAERIYSATTTVALNTRQEQVIDLKAVTSGLGTDYSTVMTETQVLTSRNLMRRVVEKLDLTKDPDFNPELAATLRGEPSLPAQLIGALRGSVTAAMSLFQPAEEQSAAGAEPAPPLSPENVAIDILLGTVTVASEEYVPVFDITVKSRSAAKAARIANAIADAYIVNQLDTKFDATAKATEWLTDRVIELKARVEDAERKVEDFLASSKLVSEEALQLQNKRLKDLRARLAQAREEAAAASAKSAEASRLVADGDIVGAAKALDSRELSPILAEYDRATGDRKDILAARLPALVERDVARLRQSADESSQQARLLADSVTGIEADLGRQSDDLIKLRQLKREAEASRALYQYFLTRQSETAVQEGMQQADARVLSEAVARTSPVSPRVLLTVVMAIFLGGFGGVAYVVVTSTWDTRFKTPSEVGEVTGLALLGTTPSLGAKSRRKLFEHLLGRGNSDMAESLRNIRTSVLLSNIDTPPKVAMVTSSMPGEGKTSLSLGLATVTAATRKNVLLIECDMRRRVFHHYFGKPEKPGLVSVLTGEAQLRDAVSFDETSGIFVLHAEQTVGNPADLYSSDSFARLVDEARENFDFVILDTPPLLAVSDARMIARVADAVVFCIRWRKATRAVVNDALELLTMQDVPVTGAVLTQVDRKRIARYSYGGYGSYKAVYGYYQKS